MSPLLSKQSQLQERAYTTLNTAFTSQPHATLEIEILPPALEPTASLLLQDGPNLGIPKKTLALAYVHARTLFFAHHRLEDQASRATALDATRVMLLFDPEHLTAANYRKRHLCYLQTGDREVWTEALWAERRLLDSILTSPLHRQSKSPTLWAHRAWWLDLAMTVLRDSNAIDKTVFCTEELAAATKAGERHPKNYYAWVYARRLVRTAEEALGGVQFQDWLGTCVTEVARWCRAHVGDVSGFSFLEWVLGLLEEGQERGRIVGEVAAYAMDVRLANECPWIFVRTTMANGSVEKGDKVGILGAMEKCRDKLAQKGEEPLLKDRLVETLEWIVRNETKDTPASK